MTTAPIALTVHDGRGPLPEHLREIVAAWLKANRINPDQVSSDHPVSVLTVPYRPAADDGSPWLLQIIAFHQLYTGPDGDREENFLTRKAVSFQRTVPLIVSFPDLSETADEGPDHGEADRKATQEAPQEVVRPAGQEGVPD